MPRLTRPDRGLEVVGSGLSEGSPPLGTGTAFSGNLSALSTSFVGRGQELKQLVGELAARQLITLTGSGGVGKTRLATEAARSAAAGFGDGVWLCELAPVSEPEAVAHAVASTLSIRRQEGLAMVDSVVEALHGRRLLLILDNCEHVLDAAGQLVARITTSCPTVAVLATSREPFGAAGERVWPVSSLAGEEGVGLFCDRAVAADATFSPTDENMAVITGICNRLDGIPLAIELAAARVRSMTPADLAARLDDRFRLLGSGRRGGVERHRTLRAAVEWSYQLLADEDRELFDRLAVFPGGFDLAAAEAVCAEGVLECPEVGDVLAGLVDKSMVLADLGGTHARYRLLETLRQFGEERLADSSELAAVRDRHLAHFTDVALRAGRDATGAKYSSGVAVLEAEWDNFRAALVWAVATGDAARASQLVETLRPFAVWRQRHELGDWADQVLELDGAASVAYGVAADFASQRGDHERALLLTRLGNAAATGDRDPGTRLCAEVAARAYWYSGEVPAGWAAGQTWVRLCDPTKEPFEAAWAALRLATFAFVVDPPCAPEHVARARRLGAPLANPALDIHITVVTGMLERAAGHYVAALVHFRRATELAAETGNLYLEGLATLSIGFMAPRMDAVDAAKALHDALTRLYASRNWLNLWAVMEALALHWARTGHDERAAVLIGYLENGDIRHAVFVDRRQKAFAALRQSVDAEAWLAVGAGLDRDQVVAYALNELDDLPVENVAAANLTKREREIVTLVATGLTNQAIGEQLFISERTVDTHITSIRRKLGTTTRTQLAVWGLENLQN